MSPPSRRIASAPGKMVVAGEYAVLEGHRAVVAAVDRRATCTLERDQAGSLRVAGLGRGPFVVEDTGTGARFLGDEHDDLRLIRAVLDECLRQGLPLPAGTLRVDSTALNVTDATGQVLKLGLGSSAAVAAAVTTCVAAEAGDAAFAAEPFPLAYAAHRAFSLGRGSGIDVAAACYGGLVEFQRVDDVPRGHPAPRFPAGLQVVAVFTGRSQDTRVFLDEVRRLKDQDRTRYDDVIGGIAEDTAAFLQALDDGDGAALIAAADRCRQAMDGLGRAAGIDIVSAPHQDIARIAAQHGAAAKPSGAGGGDVALAFCRTADRAALEVALRQAGYPVLKLSLGAPGARTESLGH